MSLAPDALETTALETAGVLAAVVTTMLLFQRSLDPLRPLSRHCLIRNGLLALTAWYAWRGWRALASVLVVVAVVAEVTLELLHQLGCSVDPYEHKVLNFYRWADPLWASPHVQTGGYNHYTEGLLDDGEGPHQPLPATHAAKFRWMYRECGGDDAAGVPLRVLDVGCGNGEFLRYCLDCGAAAAVGLTPSPPQVARLRAEGLDAREIDVWDLDAHPDLHGRFDAVVMNGSSEHFLNVTDRDPAVQRARFTRCFALLRRCLDPASPHRRCVLTAIACHRDLGPWEYVQSYLLERSYGGRYVATPDLHASAAAAAGWRHVRTENRTVDYLVWARRIWWHVWKGVAADPATLARVLADVPVFLVNDPYGLHRWMHCVLGTWAWQFAPPGAPWLAAADTPPTRHQWVVLEAP